MTMRQCKTYSKELNVIGNGKTLDWESGTITDECHDCILINSFLSASYNRSDRH